MCLLYILLYSLCNWFILFFIRTVPMCCRLVHLCHWYPWASTKWGCCLYISALVCTSASFKLDPHFLLREVPMFYTTQYANFQLPICIVCIFMHCISSKRELLLIITFVCIYLIAAVLVMTAAQQFSVLLLLLVTRQQPCEPIKLLDFCTWFSDWLTCYDHCCTLKPVYGDGGHTYGHYPFTSFPGSVLKKWGGKSLC